MAGADLAGVRDGDLLTVRDAAALVGVAAATVNGWVDHGRVPVAVIDGRRWVLVRDVSEVEVLTRRARVGRPRRDAH